MCGEEMKCPKCGGCCGEEEDNKSQEGENTQEEKTQKISSHDEMNLAILLALVPAMTMSLFNLMGLM